MIGILGGGLAGLCAARRLEELGRRDYVVIEGEGEAGGLCRSWRSRGYVFDYGPHIIYTGSSRAMLLFRSFLRGNLLEKRRENFIRLYGSLVRYPFEAFLHGLPPEVILECLEGVIEARERREAHAPSNFREWILATFGEGLARHYFIPYNLKVWKHPLERMGLDWIAGRVPTPDLRDMIRGALGLQDRDFGPNATFFYPRRGGIGALPRSLAASVSNIRAGLRVISISPSANGLRVECEGKGGPTSFTFSRVISTLALPSLVPLIDGAPAEVRRAARALIHTRLLCAGIGVRRPRLSDKHSIYFPEKEIVFNRISFPMNLSPCTAPKGRSSILAEVTVPRSAAIDERRAGDEVLAGLRRTGVLEDRDDIEYFGLRTYDYAYVVYDLNHRKNVGTIHEHLRGAGIVPAGRFGEWEYLNMDRTMLSGERAAEEVARRRRK
ncbi:MAG: protoporphyrinogen/coproporphyrinogen oxidase [Thermoplasmatota archaeon]